MKYELLSGEEIHYTPPDDAVGAFLARVFDAASDPRVTVQEITDLVYGTENPMLDMQSMPGRAVVTRAVHADPVWWVMQDLVGRKRVATGHLDVAKTRARYTMTVTEAAARRGVHESAIRQAIAARRLPAWKDGGTWLLCPEDVDLLHVKRRAPAPAERTLGAELQARIGAELGAHLKIAGAQVAGERRGGVREGTIAAGWTALGVLTGKGASARFFRLEPGSEAGEVGIEDFYLRGPFAIVEHENNPRRAREAFVAFRKSAPTAE